MPSKKAKASKKAPVAKVGKKKAVATNGGGSQSSLDDAFQEFDDGELVPPRARLETPESDAESEVTDATPSEQGMEDYVSTEMAVEATVPAAREPVPPLTARARVFAEFNIPRQEWTQVTYYPGGGEVRTPLPDFPEDDFQKVWEKAVKVPDATLPPEIFNDEWELFERTRARKEAPSRPSLLANFFNIGTAREQVRAAWETSLDAKPPCYSGSRARSATGGAYKDASILDYMNTTSTARLQHVKNTRASNELFSDVSEGLDVGEDVVVEDPEDYVNDPDYREEGRGVRKKY